MKKKNLFLMMNTLHKINSYPNNVNIENLNKGQNVCIDLCSSKS